MPLETLLDRFDAATHHELDRAVDKTIKDDDLQLGDVLHSNLGYIMLLQVIIENSNGDLDAKYLGLQHAKQLIKTHGELRGMLDSAWKRKSYRDIRNLAILKAPGVARVPVPPAQYPITECIDLAQGLSGAFEAKYRGTAVDGFYEYLTHSEKLFRDARGLYCAKLCSVVQSSGTGKSRMLTELRKKGVIIIYMNLREEQDDVVDFPERDPIPSNILTNFPPTVEEYQTICYAFLTALFDTLDDYLLSNYTTRSAKAGVMHWVDQMCDMGYPPRSTARMDFFQKLNEKYKKVHADLAKSLPRQSGASTMSFLSERRVIPPVSSYFSVVLSDAYQKVGARLANIFPDAPYEPKLVIAIDEAHTLSPNRTGYRPADIFYIAANDYTYVQNYGVWVVFASTTSKVADFSPPNQKFDSARFPGYGEKKFPPYTQLGWDQRALGLGEIGMEDVSKLDNILGYGRPLWISLKTAHAQTHKVLRTASSELYGGGHFNLRNINQVLAILGQRFCLNITLGHPDSVEYLERGVASHLRICLAMTLDRKWRLTSYPSEPLLSCVAANNLHAYPTNMAEALSTLLMTINSGMVNMGQRGELASRLLWLLAKDLFIRTHAKNVVTEMPTTWEAHLPDCQMIPVVDWLEFVFGPQIWGSDDTQASLARKTFEHAYLNFSHWLCMEVNIVGSKEENTLDWEKWTLRHWQRTSAVQCCHQQPLIDKIIPIYFKDGPEKASAGSRMSQILVSDKTLKSKSSKDVLHTITRKSQHLSNEAGKQDSDSLPYIAILADLGQPPSFSVTFPDERDVDDRCLRVYAAGVDATTYPFLTNHPELMQALQDLVRLQQVPETKRPFTEYLNAQVKFGSTATPEHMVWEHGREVPDVKGKSARRD